MLKSVASGLLLVALPAFARDSVELVQLQVASDDPASMLGRVVEEVGFNSIEAIFRTSLTIKADCIVPETPEGTESMLGENCQRAGSTVQSGTTCTILARSGHTCTSPGTCIDGKFAASGECMVYDEDETEPASLAKSAYHEMQGRASSTTQKPQLKWKNPPVLWTLPGAGNTWVRQLIDYALQGESGSLYGDTALQKTLPGEPFCRKGQTVIKAHPVIGGDSPHFHMRFSTLFERNGVPSPRCKEGGIDHFEAAIVVLRDPVETMWAEYNRFHCTQSHLARLKRKEFDAANFNNFVRAWAGITEEVFRDDYMKMAEKSGKDHILFVRFKDLTNKVTRVQTLRSIVAFLSEDTVPDERLRSAFAASEEKLRPPENKTTDIMRDDAFTPKLRQVVHSTTDKTYKELVSMR